MPSLMPFPSGSNSIPFGVPSPSQSAVYHALVVSVKSTFVTSISTHGSFGSVSLPFGVPSPSQSAVNHADVGVKVTKIGS